MVIMDTNNRDTTQYKTSISRLSDALGPKNERGNTMSTSINGQGGRQINSMPTGRYLP